MLERISNIFYDPWIFWGAPLVLAFALEGWRRLRRHRDKKTVSRGG
jgi:hypothetical protein